MDFYRYNLPWTIIISVIVLLGLVTVWGAYTLAFSQPLDQSLSPLALLEPADYSVDVVDYVQPLDQKVIEVAISDFDVIEELHSQIRITPELDGVDEKILTASLTPTPTSAPPSKNNTLAPYLAPTHTSSFVATETIAPSPTNTEKPTNTPKPEKPTNTLKPEKPTNTPKPEKPTNTPKPEKPTKTPKPEKPTNTPEPL